MASTPEPIARIRLLRAWPLLLTVPALLTVLATGWTVVALVVVGGLAGLVLAALALVPLAAGVVLVASVSTMRVEVAEASVHVRWLGGARHYALVPGPVTRVRLRGDEASSLRARRGILGWQLGEARLRDEEEIEVVRLAPTRTAILVPTDRGRLAIAAASEPELLEALAHAARARERRAEEAPEAEAVEPGPAPGTDDIDDRATEAEMEEPAHVLTGIERAMLDERLAQELRQRMEADRLEAERREAERQAELEARARAEAQAREEAHAREEAERRPPTLRDRLPAAALLVAPLAATLVVWGIGLATARLPDAGSADGRLTALALVLAGPASSIGAIMARTWWPRLVGVVVAGALTSTIFIARAVLGG